MMYHLSLRAINGDTIEQVSSSWEELVEFAAQYPEYGIMLYIDDFEADIDTLDDFYQAVNLKLGL